LGGVVLKIKYSRLFTVLIFIYLLIQFGINLFSKSVNTVILENEHIEFTLSERGLILRDEYLVTSNFSGQVSLLVEEGEKVAKSQELCTIYSDKNDIEVEEEINSLNEEIDKLKSGEVNISSKDLINLNEKIDKIVGSIQENILNENYDIKEEKEEVVKLIEERNRLLNNDIDTKALETKENQRDILQSKLDNNMENIICEISGIVSFKYDDNEEKYNLDKLTSLTKEDIKNATNNYKDINLDSKVKQNNPIMRIIDANKNYVAICIEKSDKFEEGKSVKLKYDDVSLDAKVDSIYENDGDFFVILKITNQNVTIYDTRVQEFDIIYKQIDGIKIPKTAIEEIDGEMGVYVISQENYTSSFVKLEGIVYEDETYVYIDEYTNRVNGVNTVSLYDEIILKPNKINKNMKIR
jgi:putative membrane fusion protein